MTTTGPRSARSRFFACARAQRRAPRRRNARPAKRVAGQKTASGIFFAVPSKTHLETATQTLGTHQRNSVFAYDFASGCAVAPNSGSTNGLAAFADAGRRFTGDVTGWTDFGYADQNFRNGRWVTGTGYVVLGGIKEVTFFTGIGAVSSKAGTWLSARLGSQAAE
ncbi:MAG: hypothetical protein ACREIA_18395, partial [Opitutaceae bacterium]